MTKDNPHQNVLVDLSDDIDSACRTLSKHPQGLALFSEVIDMLRLHEKRLDAFLADVPDNTEGLKHLEEFGETHRKYEDNFETATELLNQATRKE